MPNPFVARFGPFTKGVNALIDAINLDPSTATDASNVDLSTGALECYPNVGTKLKSVTVPVTSKFICYGGRNAWLSSDYPQFACGDAGATYYTQLTDLTGLAASYPMVKKGAAAAYRLGVIPPAAAPTATLSLGGSTPPGDYYFKVCFGRFSSATKPCDPISNPSPVSAKVTVTSGYNVYVTPPANSNSFNGYSVFAGTSPTGPFYFVGSYPTGPSSFNFGSMDVTQPLNWDAGGSSSSTSTLYDHSLPPNLTVLANQLHAVAAGAGGSGAGILFGAVDNVVWWSELGQPHYWPTMNYQALPDTVEAIVTHSAQTFVFTRTAVYSFSGVDDEGLSLSKTNAGFGVAVGAGRTVTQTAYGILFVADDGLALFDGRDARIISNGFLPDDFFRRFTNMSAAWWDRSYILFHAAETLIFDMTIWPEIRMIPCPTVANAAHVAMFKDANFEQEPGLHVLLSDGSGSIYPWGSGSIGSIYGAGTSATAFAGSTSGSGNGFTNGALLTARFNFDDYSSMVILPNGDMVVSDTSNHVLRLISGGQVSNWTAPGNGSTASFEGLHRSVATLLYPRAMAIDEEGSIYVACGLGVTIIVKIDAAGTVTRFAGQDGIQGTTDGNRLTTAKFNNIYSMDLDRYGNMYVCHGQSAIKRIVAATGNVESYLSSSNISGRGAGFFSPRTLLCDRMTDLLYFTDLSGPSGGGNGIYFFKADAGKTVTELASNTVSSGTSYGLAMDSLGAIYLSLRGIDYFRVLKFSNGAWSHFWGKTTYPWTGYSAGTVPGNVGILPPGQLRIADDGALYLISGHGILWVDGAVVQSSSWSFETADFTGGDPNRLKSFDRLRLTSEGSVSVQVIVDDTPIDTLTESGWIAQCAGQRLRLKISSPDGTGRVKFVDVDGVLYDGT